MPPTLRLPQTAVRCFISQAVETLRLVEIEVVGPYSRFQPKEPVGPTNTYVSVKIESMMAHKLKS